MSGYWYVGPAPDGRRFCWAKTPTFECPVYGWAASFLRGDSLAESPSSERVFDAAGALGVEPKWLAQKIGRGHGRKRDLKGNVTDRCECGAKMERLGYAFWAERPAPEREDPGAQISRRLFGSEPVERTGETRYADTKKEAERWAREELRAAREAA